MEENVNFVVACGIIRLTVESSLICSGDEKIEVLQEIVRKKIEKAAIELCRPSITQEVRFKLSLMDPEISINIRPYTPDEDD